jgi:hypothetical protein
MYLQKAVSPLLPFTIRHSSERILPLKSSHCCNVKISAACRGGAIRSPIQRRQDGEKIFSDVRVFTIIGPVREGGLQGNYEVVAMSGGRE